ncbi:response regulator transcription factor [Paenibacillus eucommiae]|uniref:DNA-binding NarL/FixJ family response regulator n=1 Tax=Paenibacillus eucommiae TaxID=1355755 RepID=A0ABS4J371_9BACL|nr:response regulator transcription factor [Paenibacillus eucommiae]MBP1994296.1 DNA-binding NarL/FixJ family response regulator [Paenibacillus eucommiae]
MDKLKVLIAEDDHLLRTGIALIIDAEPDMAVAGSVEDGEQALAAIERSKPDLVLLDLQMPRMDGITCIRHIRRLHADLPILILTTFNEEEYIFQGLAYGANGYLLKNLDFRQLTQTIRDAAQDRSVLPAEVAAKIARYVMNDGTYMKERGLVLFFERNPHFSPKEQQLIKLLLGRLSNKEIASQLFLAEGTVKNALTRLYEKLEADSRIDAIHKLEALLQEAN